jgi:hypothetical protein
MTSPDEKHRLVPFTEGCPFPSVVTCSCGFDLSNTCFVLGDDFKKLKDLTVDELMSMDADRFKLIALEACQTATHHFRKVYRTNGCGRPKHGTLRFNLHRLVQQNFQSELSDNENIDHILEIIKREKTNLKSIKQQRIWEPTNRSDLREAVTVAVQSFRPVRHLWSGPMKYADKLKCELIYLQDPELANSMLVSYQ